MWSTARYTFGLSEDEFWELSPGQWVALYNAYMAELRVQDAMNARVCATIASTVPRKSKTRIKEASFRLFPENRKPRGTRLSSEMLLNKMRLIVASQGIPVMRG